MTRIVAGAAGGRRLVVPPGAITRPTSDRAREAMFATVDGLIPLRGAHVLDLYAGSGALGLEALSRGAAHALFVEQDRRVSVALRANIDAVGLDGAAVHTSAAQRVAATEPAKVRGAAAPYNVILADPPYRQPADQLETVLIDLHRLGWLAAGAVLVVERSSREEPWVWPTPLSPIRDRQYGEALLWYGRAP